MQSTFEWQVGELQVVPYEILLQQGDFFFLLDIQKNGVNVISANTPVVGVFNNCDKCLTDV
jgi:hypothetical protein